MKALVQRVTEASVTVDGQVVGKISRGLCVFLGIHQNDSQKDMDYIVSRLLTVKLWPDDTTNAPWKKSVADMNGQILVVSQFTLYSIIGRKGRAPDFHLSMKASQSKDMFHDFVKQLKTAYKEDAIQTGLFQAYMNVDIKNDGPVTIELESREFKNVSLDLEPPPPPLNEATN